MFRKVTLTAVNIGTQFITGRMIQKKIREMRPDLFLDFNEDVMSKDEIVKVYARVIGITLAITIVSAAVAALVTNAVDNVAFPNDFGPY